METRSMQGKLGKSVTELGLAQHIRVLLQFLLSITVLISIILSYPYWSPCPSLQKLGHPLLNSLPSLLDRKFMFLFCNVILVFISSDSILVIKKLPSKKELDVYDKYLMKKNYLSLTQVSNTVGGPRSTATKSAFQRTGADVKETKETEAGTLNEAREALGGGREAELIPDGLEREEEEKHFREEDRRFDEFIARGHENWRREQQQLLNSKA